MNNNKKNNHGGFNGMTILEGSTQQRNERDLLMHYGVSFLFILTAAITETILTPLFRVFLEKLTVLQLEKYFSVLYMQKLFTASTNACHWIQSLASSFQFTSSKANW